MTRTNWWLRLAVVGVVAAIFITKGKGSSLVFIASLSLVVVVAAAITSLLRHPVYTAHWCAWIVRYPFWFSKNEYCRHQWKRMLSALHEEDTVSARRYLDRLAYLRRFPGNLPRLNLDEAVLLSCEDRFREAKSLLSQIDPATLGKDELYLRNNIAWCDVNLGQPASAIAALEPVVRDIQSAPPDLRASILGTSGIAHALAGEPAQAVSLLEEALNTKERNSGTQSIRAFYLGDAYSALGETAKAKAAYQRAIDECPTSRYAERAREKLLKNN